MMEVSDDFFEVTVATSDEQTPAERSKADFSTLCRICAGSNEYLIPIFEGEGVQLDLRQKIEKYLPVKINSTDELPTSMCYQCASSILNWHELVENCVEADKQLKCIKNVKEEASDITELWEEDSPDCDRSSNVKSASISSKESCSKLGEDSISPSPVSLPKFTASSSTLSLPDIKKEFLNDVNMTDIKSSKELSSEKSRTAAFSDHHVTQVPKKNFTTELRLNLENKFSSVNILEANSILHESPDRSYCNQTTGFNIFSKNVNLPSSSCLNSEHGPSITPNVGKTGMEVVCKLCNAGFVNEVELRYHSNVFHQEFNNSKPQQSDLTDNKKVISSNALISSVKGDKLSGSNPPMNETSGMKVKTLNFRSKKLIGSDFDSNFSKNYPIRVINKSNIFSKSSNMDNSNESLLCPSTVISKSENKASDSNRFNDDNNTRFNESDKYLKTNYRIDCMTDEAVALKVEEGFKLPERTESVSDNFQYSGPITGSGTSNSVKFERQNSNVSDGIDSERKIGHNLANCLDSEQGKMESKPSIKKKKKKKKKSESKVDNDVRLFVCDYCSKKFTLKDSLVRHIRIHTNERPYSCHLCSKKFRDSGGLSRHVRDVHVKLKEFGCDICPKRFASKATLLDHRRIHTKERPFTCEFCGKLSKTKAALYLHSKIHSNEFPFTCKECNKSFKRRFEYNEHKSFHTGEKSYICDQCGRRFRLRSEIIRHLAVHSKEKPFNCNVCAMSFRQNRYLKSHMLSKHSDIKLSPGRPQVAGSSTCQVSVPVLSSDILPSTSDTQILLGNDVDPSSLQPYLITPSSSLCFSDLNYYSFNLKESTETEG